MATIDVPDLVRDGTLLCIVSMSGGKDSTATAQLEVVLARAPRRAA